MFGIFVEEDLGLIVKVVLLYDIGKVGILDYILYKLGLFLIEEFEIMKRYS